MRSQSREFDTTALIALPAIAETAAPEKGLLSWSRPYLIDEIRKQGVDVAVTRGVKSLDVEAGIARSVTRPEYRGKFDVTIEELGDVALDAFAMMRSIVKVADVDYLLPVLNPTALRTHARHKSRAAQDLLRPAGAYNRQSVLVRPGDVAAGALDTLGGEFLVAKPDIGRRSGGVAVGDRYHIAEYLDEQTDLYIVEEKLDFSFPMPGIKGVDEVQQARWEQANTLGVNKELRMYYFGDGVWDSVARVAKPDETDFRQDEWVFIDGDSIPNEVYIKSAKIVDHIKARIGTDEVNVAFDWVYGSSASEPEPHWEVMEVNVAEPQLVKPSEHREIGKRQHTKLATQIARIAVS